MSDAITRCLAARQSTGVSAKVKRETDDASVPHDAVDIQTVLPPQRYACLTCKPDTGQETTQAHSAAHKLDDTQNVIRKQRAGTRALTGSISSMRTPFRQLPVAAATAMLFSAVTTYAQTPVVALDDIVITASRTPQLAREIVGDVTVIGPDELRKAGQSSVAEILARHAGIQVDISGGPQSVTGIGIRGNQNSHTLVLLDGMRINSSAQVGVHWNAIDPAAIERIEILRGAASSLYGSDAIGGVINIITRKDRQDRPLTAWFNMGIGTHDTVRSALGVSGASRGWDYSVTASRAVSDGFDATHPYAAFDIHDPDKDGYTKNSVSGSVGYAWREGQHIGITAYNALIDGDFDAGAFYPRAHGMTRQQAYTITSTNQINARWESILRVGFTKDAYEDRAYQSGYGSIKRTYVWQNNLRLTPDHQLSGILERNEERPWQSGAFTQDFDVKSRNTNTGTLIYRGTWASVHHIQASVRHDRFSGHGNRSTGSLGYDLDLTHNWKIGVSGNTAFRLPTFVDLYYPNDGFFQGNPALKPEKSRNIEARLSYETDRTHISIVAYQNKVRDLILGSVCEGTGPCTAQNAEKATIRGATLSGRHQFNDTAIHASIDVANPKNDVTDTVLQRRARAIYRAGVDQSFGKLTTGAEFTFVGKRYDDKQNQIRLGGYSLLNLTAVYEFSDKVRVQARWNNVLDKQYSTAYGYRSAGSNVFLDFGFRL